MRKYNIIKKLICALVIVSLLLCDNMIFFAEKIDAFSNKEYDAPFGEPNEFVSENIIIDKNKIEVLTPLNPTPSDIKKDENYKLVDNYNIDLKTLHLRVEYFSPTYLYAKNVASNQIVSNIYMGGGSMDNIDTLRNTISNLPSQKGIYASTVKQLNSAISGYTKAYLYVKNINNNFNLVNLKNQLTKAMSTAVISYLQLNQVIKIYESQVKLYTDIYKINQQNVSIGLSTSKDLKKSQVDLENAKKNLNAYKNTMKHLKEVIASNLGYSIRDINKLKFAEPTINEEYVNNININEDYKMAYYSNSTYDGLRKGGEKNKKLPESTSRLSYENILKQTEEKVIVALDLLYNNLLNCKKKYEISAYDREILKLNQDSSLNKYNNDLATGTEYLGLKIQNLATEMEVVNAKYNYVSAINNYYYGTMGIVDIE